MVKLYDDDRNLKKCKRCDKKGNPYQAYRILTIEDQKHYETQNKLSAYRCFCYFCDDCIKKVMIEHIDILYERIFTEDERIQLYQFILKKINKEVNPL